VKAPKVFWMPVAPDGWWCTDILAERRCNAIQVLLHKPWRDVMWKTWPQLRREGWRCIKVWIVAAESKPIAKEE